MRSNKNEENENRPAYHFTTSQETLHKINQYKEDLKNNRKKAGKFLEEKLANKDLQSMSDEQFAECLVQTKKYMIFAESTRFDGNFNWNGTEISLLGDISCVVNVEVYDDGEWAAPEVHNKPFEATLIYVPGALLVNKKRGDTPDYNEVCKSNKKESPEIDFESYYKLYERRLLPGLLDVNQKAEGGKKLLITIPGVGCGQFGGNVSKEDLYSNFKKILIKLLENHGDKLKNIAGLWYDPFNPYSSSEEPSTETINDIEFNLRPLDKKDGKPQLSHPEEFGEKYKDCKLVSIVAWDHVSWPGNDFWGNARSTDDGVKAAATNTMEVMCGHKGEYNEDENKFLPVISMEDKSKSKSWKEIATEMGSELIVSKNLVIHHFESPVERKNRDFHEESSQKTSGLSKSQVPPNSEDNDSTEPSKDKPVDPNVRRLLRSAEFIELKNYLAETAKEDNMSETWYWKPVKKYDTLKNFVDALENSNDMELWKETFDKLKVKQADQRCDYDILNTARGGWYRFFGLSTKVIDRVENLRGVMTKLDQEVKDSSNEKGKSPKSSVK